MLELLTIQMVKVYSAGHTCMMRILISIRSHKIVTGYPRAFAIYTSAIAFHIYIQLYYYKKCIVYKDRLVGAILIGDKSEFQEFKELIASKTELGEKRLQLLRSGKKPEPVLGKLVCSCNTVGSDNIKNKIADGCQDFKQLCAITGAGTGCGSCRPEVKKILDSYLEKQQLSVVKEIVNVRKVHG